jgi:hypothetical protein
MTLADSYTLLQLAGIVMYCTGENSSRNRTCRVSASQPSPRSWPCRTCSSMNCPMSVSKFCSAFLRSKKLAEAYSARGVADAVELSMMGGVAPFFAKASAASYVSSIT